MPRWITHLFIASYLGSLALGVAMHTTRFKHDSHPVMYFYVWDMFCGWAAFESRTHLIGEGESGTYYQLSPGPWDDFKPYGDLTRNHYDYHGNALVGMALNALKHTDHEPMRRILFIEESWPKKYNLPDSLWAAMFTEDKDPMSYFWVRGTYTPEGERLDNRLTFLNQLYTETVMNNPRLQADSKKGRPVIAINPYDRRLHSEGTAGSQEQPSLLEGLPSAN
ncbi:MAG: hypothetical protein U0872_15215 [Planctomycetaceae bacterium]